MLGLLFAVLLLPPVAILLLRAEPVQTYAARKATQFLSKQLHTTVDVKRLYLSWFLTLELDGVTVLDKHKNIIIKAKNLRAKVNKVDLKTQKLRLDEIAFNDADLNLHYYEKDKELNVKFIVDYFSPKNADTAKVTKPWKVSCERIRLNNINFGYRDERIPESKKGINFADLQISKLRGLFHHLRVIGGKIITDVKYLSFKEKSGFELKNISTGLTLSSTGSEAKGLQLETANSSIFTDLAFQYQSWADFGNFIENIRILADVTHAKLDMRDIAYFVPSLDGMNDVFDFSGNLKGTVSSLSAKKFNLQFGEKTLYSGEIKLTGLPNIEETFAHLKIDVLRISPADIQKFLLPGGKHIVLPDQVKALGNIFVKGKFTGFYNDFVSNATFITDAGKVTTDILLTNKKTQHTFEYKGKILADGFNVGRVLKIKKLGPLNADLTVNGKNFTFNKADVSVKGKVTNLYYDGNVYDLVNIDGRLKDKKFAGDVNIKDQLLELAFNGSVDMSKNAPVFDFKTNITKADLQKMHLMVSDSITWISMKAELQFTGNKIDNLLGTVKIDSATFKRDGKLIKLNNLTLTAEQLSPDNKRMELKSDFVDAVFTGKYTFDDLEEYILTIVNDYLPSITRGKRLPPRTNKGSFEYTIYLKNTRPLTNMFTPWLVVDNKTVISGAFDPAAGKVQLNGQSPLIRVSGFSFRDWALKGYSEANSLIMDMTSAVVDKSDKTKHDTTDKHIDQFQLLARAKQDKVGFAIGWDDKAAADHYKGNIQGGLSFAEYPRLSLNLDKADIIINDTLWKITPNNYLVYDTAFVKVNNFGFTHGNQHIIFDGSVSKHAQDILNVDFKDFNISNADMLVNSFGIDLDGYVSGKTNISGIYGVPKVNADLLVTKFGFNHEYLGNAEIKSDWDNQKSVLALDMRVIYYGNASTFYPVFAKGYIYPDRKHNNFDLEAKIDNFKIKAMEPFFKGLFSNLRGNATGNLTLTGDFSEPVLKGSLKLMRSELMVDYTKTSYSFTGDVNFDKGKIWFEDLPLNDSTIMHGMGKATGVIRHHGFKDWYLDVTLKADKLAALNTQYTPAEMYYGFARATGTMTLRGPVNNLALVANVRSEKGTEITIPISFARGISKNDFIQYKYRGDSTEQETIKKPVDKSVLTMQMNMEVNPNAEINIILPYQMGNISARGDGDVSMGIDTRGEYSMHGQYRMDRGNFLFSFENILKRDFEIQKGGVITFNGSPLDADINLKAVYKLRTSLAGLPNVSDAYSGVRVPVDCIISLTNSLFNPEIKFSVDLPDASEEVKRMVFTSIDTTNAIAMNQQMVSLLVLGSFSSTGGINLSGIDVGSSTYDILNNQFNSWLSMLVKDVDIGVNIRPGDQISPTELEFALSKQLFDNRLSITTNLGSSTTTGSAEQTTRLVGDVLVEYKITPDGRFRVKAFNRTNSALDAYTGQAPYTQGVGVAYRKEFDNLKDLFKRQKKLKLKKNEIGEAEKK